MNPTTRAQFDRHRRIVNLIRSGMSTGVYANAGTFMRAFGISRRTVIRDLDTLRDDEGAPIEYDPSLKGYYLTDKSWVLPPIRLSRQEVFAFSMAGKLMGAFKGTPLEVNVGSLIEKIGQSLEGAVTLNPAVLTEHLTVLEEDYVTQDPATWGAVAEAVDRREQLAIVYQTFDGRMKRYVLDPYHLFFYHGNWYVVGKNRTGDRVATFAVSRIREWSRTGEGFEVEKSFDLKKHIAQSFGIVRGEDLMRVRLLFSPRVAVYIRERVWHPSQRVHEKRDGSVELRMETAGWKALVQWILSWQPDVNVLSPVCLRDRVMQKMQQGLKAMAGK